MRESNSQNPFFEEVQGEELKHKESLMEGNSLKKVELKLKKLKESENEVQKKLENLKENVKWNPPQSNIFL